MIDEVARKLQQLFDDKEAKTRRWNALVGDGAGNVTVTDDPDFTWVRYLTDQSKVSKVHNIEWEGLVEDVPVIVGRMFPESEFEDILAVDTSLYRYTMSAAAVQAYSKGKHGDDHNAASGTDPASIDLRNLVEMRGRPQATPDLTIFVERTQYIFGDTVKQYPGENIDLTASVPGVAGHQYVLVYVDGLTNTVGSIDGGVVPLAVAAPIPDPPISTIPVCLVDLEENETEITEDDIFDWRFLWQLFSNAAPSYIGTDADRLALTLANLAELTKFYTTDTDKVWDVWEGAWRIFYPPPALSSSDGDAISPWTTDANGVLTGIKDLQLDDGAGDSPALVFLGGSNDDLIQFFLEDDPDVGESELILSLAGNDGESGFEIVDILSNVKFRFDSDGELTQTQKEALTNTVADFQILRHETTGTAAAGFGIRNLFQLEEGGGNLDDAAAMTIEWEDAASGSEDSLIRFYLRKGGAVLGEFVKFSASESIFNQGGADVDFRVEGVGVANALFVQGSNGAVGINDGAPGAQLNVAGDVLLDGTVTNAYAFKIFSVIETNVNRGLMQVQGTIDPTAAGLTLFGQLFLPKLTSSALNVTTIIGSDYRIDTDATYTGNVTNMRMFTISNPTHAGAGAISTVIGIRIGNLNVGTNNRGIQSVISAAAGKHNLYISGTADNYLEGDLGIGAPSPGSKVEIDLATEDFEIVDAGSAAATEQDWVQVQVGNVTGYLHVFAAK